MLARRPQLLCVSAPTPKKTASEPKTPYPAHWTVRAARDAYLAENGFTLEAYEQPRTKASFLWINFTIPNTPTHRWAIMNHDLHHVATGFGTDLTGEGEISAWEAHGGVRPLGAYVGAIVVVGTLFGFLIAPLRSLRGWRASTRRESLFHRRHTYEALLEMTVGELRRTLGVPDAGVATQPRGLHPMAQHRSA